MNPQTRRTRRVIPRVDTLEGRAMLSTATAGAALTAQWAFGTAQQYLNGSVNGTYRISPVETQTYILSGTGTISPLGSVSVTGSVHGTGFQAGRAGGMIELIGRTSRSLLKLIGPYQGSLRPPPSGTYDYLIEAGMGRGHTGTAAVRFGNGTFSIQFPA